MIYILIECKTLKKYSVPAIAQHLPEGSRVALYGIGKPTDLSLVPFRDLSVLRCEGIFNFGAWDIICNGIGIVKACPAWKSTGSLFPSPVSDADQVIVIDDAGDDYLGRMPLCLNDTLQYCRHKHQSMQDFLTSNKQRSK